MQPMPIHLRTLVMAIVAVALYAFSAVAPLHFMGAGAAAARPAEMAATDQAQLERHGPSPSDGDCVQSGQSACCHGVGSGCCESGVVASGSFVAAVMLGGVNVAPGPETLSEGVDPATPQKPPRLNG
jgi:hypothetical protein